ncbi:MAG: hypothetical protein KAJ79_08365, partial [Candidatus Omnitrophica bacterium]|nr:hypothetical protein [Candidatus Omnitrophota bacterium]
IKKNSSLDLDLEGIDFDSEEQVAKIETKNENKINDVNTEPLEDDDFLSKSLAVKWESILKNIQKVRAAIASHLSFGKPVSSKGFVVTLGFHKKDYFHKESLENSKNVQFIEETLSEAMDKAIAIKLSLNDGLDNKQQPKSRINEKTVPIATIKDTVINSTIRVDNDPEISKNVKSESKDKTENAGNDEGFINDLLDAFGGKFHNDD